MNKPSVQDIFLRFYPSYLEKYSPSPQQGKTARNIMNCKTGAYGANISVCEDCGAIQIHYNSCRNRCCPMCQAVPKELWMDARKEDKIFSSNTGHFQSIPWEVHGRAEKALGRWPA